MQKYIIDTIEQAEEFLEWLEEEKPEKEFKKKSIIIGDEEFIFEQEPWDIIQREFKKERPNEEPEYDVESAIKAVQELPEKYEFMKKESLTDEFEAEFGVICYDEPEEPISEEAWKTEIKPTDESKIKKASTLQSNPYENDLIFGKDKTEGVVAIEVKNDEVWVFKNNGEITKFPNTYWFVTPRSTKSGRKLEGNLHYKYITERETLAELKEDRGTLYKYKADFYTIFDEQESTMVYNGITFYKGLRVQDVSVLSFDIEANGLVDEKTNEPIEQEEAMVYMISCTFRDGNGEITKALFSEDQYESQESLITAFCKFVQECDPSVIIGHNIFGYDFPYLSYVYKRETGGDDLILGRDYSEITYNKRASKFRKDGSQSYDYFNAKIFGRQLIDTMFLSYKYDFARNYPSYGLKAIIEYEGLVKEDRQFYDAAQIANNWDNIEEREKIKKYGADDSDDALALYDLMIPQFFYYAQSIPKPFQKINNSATGSQINSFLVRSYLQVGHSLPKASEAEKYEGAISFGNPDIWEHVNKVDVASLYPSIMITEKVYDREKDPKGNFLEMVKYFTKERLNNKRLGKETGDRYYKDVEQGQKIVINSAYGLLGAPGLIFNSPQNAALVTRVGREILQKGIDWAECKGFSIVNVDTDSFSYTTGKKITKEEFDEQIAEINNLYKDGIVWEDDGQYRTVLVVKAKNYALKSYDKKKPVKIKGSALKASMKEIALQDFLVETMDLLLNKKKDQIFYLYNHYAQEIIADAIDISRWSSKKTVTESVLNPERTNEERILAAIKHKNFKQGDKFRVYFTTDEDKPVKLEEDYTGDHDQIKLLEKLYNTLKIFQTVIDISCFPNYKLKKNQKLLGV